MKSESTTWAGQDINDKRKEKVWWDNLKGDLGADMRILLKCISNIRG